MSGFLSSVLGLPFLKVIDETVSFLATTYCLHCREKSSGKTLCDSCGTFRLLLPGCQRCGLPTSQEITYCDQCADWGGELDLLRSGWWLTPAARTLIHKVKFEKESHWLNFLKPLPLSSLQELRETRTTIIPVPLHWARKLERGFNQSEKLARFVAKELKLNCETKRLIKVQSTQAQSLLSRAERQRNLGSSTFEWRGKALESVLLIDDIYTTGATLRACAKELKKKRVQRVSAWTLFRTPSSLGY
jgi:ComF family protein